MNRQANTAGKYWPGSTTQHLARWLCVLYYCAAIPVLINSPLILTNHEYAFAMGIPLSLCSLVAVWSVLSSRNLLLRFAVAIFVILMCWHAVTQLVWWGIGDPASAAWAFSFFLQISSSDKVHLRASDIRTLDSHFCYRVSIHSAWCAAA